MISRRIILSIGPCLALPAQAQTRPAPGQPQSLSFSLKLAEGAERRASKPETYDPAYVVLSYPMGDVPDDRGVCSDTVIRAFRYAGVDLQREVHEDMSRHFAVYPRIWGLSRPDRNIDHRRVPNLETLFRRKGGARPVSRHGSDYRPGDVVSWRLSGSGLPHIGVLSRSPGRDGPQVVHNIGAGSQIEDVLFSWPIEGWFRFETWGVSG
ncbi:MAG: DUF1287 domain-containing protein [Alphaproteobacteria bacterium]|nr:DUF1287 domain-containing protein [Alphaproteobacteria bacterium]